MFDWLENTLMIIVPKISHDFQQNTSDGIYFAKAVSELGQKNKKMFLYFNDWVPLGGCFYVLIWMAMNLKPNQSENLMFFCLFNFFS